MRNDIPHTLLVVLLVFAEAAFEPVHLAVALEGEDVGADAVHEPTVVADDYGTAAVVLDGLLQRAERVHVQVVGGFVKQ